MIWGGAALAKQGDNGLGSVRPSICLCVYLCVLSVLSCLNHKSAAKKSHYPSKVFVCVSVISSMDAVDRLLLLK